MHFSNNNNILGGFLLSYVLITDGTEAMKDEETEDTGKVSLYCGIGVAVVMGLLGLSMLWCRYVYYVTEYNIHNYYISIFTF